MENSCYNCARRFFCNLSEAYTKEAFESGLDPISNKCDKWLEQKEDGTTVSIDVAGNKFIKPAILTPKEGFLYNDQV